MKSLSQGAEETPLDKGLWATPQMDAIGIASSFLIKCYARNNVLTGKRLILVLASGGVYSNGPAKQLDFQEPYLLRRPRLHRTHRH